jgi:hypothetical protein
MGASAQGMLDWNAQFNWTISFYSPEIGTPNVMQTGDSAQDIPAGSTVYSGGWIGGTSTPPGPGVGPTPNPGPGGINYQNAANFEVGLYVDTSAAAVLTDINNEPPDATDAIRDGGIDFIPTSEATIPGLEPGTLVNIGLGAWYNGGGTINSYAAAVGAQVPAGFNISTGQLALGAIYQTPVEIPPNIGLTSFSLRFPYLSRARFLLSSLERQSCYCACAVSSNPFIFAGPPSRLHSTLQPQIPSPKCGGTS